MSNSGNNSASATGDRRGYMENEEKEGEEELKKIKEHLESVRKSLPVYQHKHEIISLIKQFQVPTQLLIYTVIHHSALFTQLSTN